MQPQIAVPRARLVFVTQNVDPQRLRAVFRGGAVAYIAKQSATGELLLALQEAAAEAAFATPLLQEVSDDAPAYRLRKATGSTADTLTTRQRKILRLIADGNTAHQISIILGITPKTVEFHKRL